MSSRSDKAVPVEHQKYYTPEWAKHVIWYQIFPERFCNGDPSNDPTAERVGGPESWKISPWTGDWYKRAEWEMEMGPDFRDGVFYRRYGGDIQGIINKLDYLQELGVGGIYLNPVFDAASLHKYDTSAYRHIDRFFGPDPVGDAAIMEQEVPSDPSTWKWTSADKLFLELVREVHRRDMRIILDAVFNHTGSDFWAFRDLEENQESSPYKDWYNVISFRDPDDAINGKFDYESWWGFKDLPELKEVDGTLIKPVRDHIAAITRRWMDPDGDGDPSDGIDGWRLDVPEELGVGFWEEWCRLVRSINRDAYIVGEVWTDKAVEYVNGKLFTAVMNYRFAATVQDYMIDRQISTYDFLKALREIREKFPEESNYVMQNLMDSHDTARLASMVVNPGREYNKEGTPEEGFNVRKPTTEERKVQKLIALFQYTYIGAPMIFYGTEAGMWGADDPDDRKPMVWPELSYDAEETHPLGYDRPKDENFFDHDLFEWYKKLGNIRKEHRVLQTGRFILLSEDSEKDVFAFVRILDRSHFAIVVINRSEHEQHHSISLSHLDLKNCTLTDQISAKKIEMSDLNIELSLEPVSGMILMP